MIADHQEILFLKSYVQKYKNGKLPHNYGSGLYVLTKCNHIETNLIIDFEADCEIGIPSQITTVDVTGGVSPYTIIWSDGIISGDDDETMTTSQNGTYVVDITDL